MEAEGGESSENEEEIRAWLDNREWDGMSSLVCGESRVECATLNTLQEVFDQERILTLMDTSDSSTQISWRKTARESPLLP